jgi:hypothetical protein
MTEQKYDDKGKLPLTDVANKDELHVHPGQIIDKGTSVLQTQQVPPEQQDADPQIIRAARPTGADNPSVRLAGRDPMVMKTNAGVKIPRKKTPIDEDQRPEALARQQSEAKTNQYKDSIEKGKSVEQNNPVNLQRSFIPNSPATPEHRTMPGVNDKAIPGSRSGNPLENFAENLMGDKVHDIRPDGQHYLLVQSKDKSRAFAFDGSDSNLEQFDEIPKMKVSFKFPSINKFVAQRYLLIICSPTDPDNQNEYSPNEFFFPPDVPNLEVLLPINYLIHAEMTHVDGKGESSAPYMIDFYSNHRLQLHPLEASPLSVEMMENVLVRVQKQAEPVHDNLDETRSAKVEPGNEQSKENRDASKAEVNQSKSEMNKPADSNKNDSSQPPAPKETFRMKK